MDKLEEKDILKEKIKISWKWNFDFSNHKEILEKIKKIRDERIFLLTIFIDDTYKFEEKNNWTNWEVSFDFSILKKQKWIKSYAVYHNHPVENNYISKTDLEKIFLSPPSSDDFNVCYDNNNVGHKILTNYWEWEIGISDKNKAEKNRYILWSLFNSLYWKEDLEYNLEIISLRKINPSFEKIAVSYNKMSVWLWKEESNKIYIENFISWMKDLWFIVSFKSY